jgi:hypothetical protein
VSAATDGGARVAAERRYREGRGLGLLWFGVLGPALAWFVHIAAGYALVLPACAYRATLAIHGLSLALLAIAIAGGWVSHGVWRDLGRSTEGEEHGVLGRSRWMAIAGMISGGWFAAVIVAQWIPVFFIPPCR